MVEEADIDILAHMGLFRRGLAQAGIRCDFNELDLWPDIMESILRVLIERDIAMELNTSGLRRRERTTYPTPDILIRYHDLGGTMITIGSDTHRKQHLFYGLKAGIEILRQAGFDSILTFRDRERRQLFVNGSVPSAAAQK
jgi:histidinol-phosphatase (PHP family)